MKSGKNVLNNYLRDRLIKLKSVHNVLVELNGTLHVVQQLKYRELK